MVKKSTFIITIVAMCVCFTGLLIAFSIYHFSKIEDMKKEKEQITILQPNQNTTGLDNVIVE